MIETENSQLILLVREFARRAEQLLPHHPSLFAGQSGLPLLNAEIFKATSIADYLENSINLIEKSIELLNDKHLRCLTCCEGHVERQIKAGPMYIG